MIWLWIECSILVINFWSENWYRVNKTRRSMAVLDNREEGEKYAEHGLRKFLRTRPPEIMPTINHFFSQDKWNRIPRNLKCSTCGRKTKFISFSVQNKVLNIKSFGILFVNKPLLLFLITSDSLLCYCPMKRIKCFHK